MLKNWQPDKSWKVITSIDAHAGGEPLRIISGGLPPLPGETILDKRRYAQEHLDRFRTALMWEPRGHADMYGCILTEPVSSDSDLGVLFIHNEGYSTMCGHAIIALTTVALDTGMVKMEGDQVDLKIDTPAGQVLATAYRNNGQVEKVSFKNVPAFVYALDQHIHVPGIGNVQYDVAFGGAFYAFCRAEDLGLKLTAEEVPQLIDLGKRIKQAVSDKLTISHPFEEDLGFLYGTIFYGPPHKQNHFSRNVCVFADEEVDRSPTGTGISARAALHLARGEIQLNEAFTVESILGTCFTGRALEQTTFGPHAAVIPEVTGSAYITGQHEFYLNPEDPLVYGFILR